MAIVVCIYAARGLFELDPTTTFSFQQMGPPQSLNTPGAMHYAC
jgi:hypothetical protein